MCIRDSLNTALFFGTPSSPNYRIYIRTSLPNALSLVEELRFSLVAGRPMAINERMTFSALFLAAPVLTATLLGEPLLGVTATTSNNTDGRRSIARLTAL